MAMALALALSVLVASSPPAPASTATTHSGFDAPPKHHQDGHFDRDVEAFGAKADGVTFSGDAFNQAIAAASAAGGGVVHARGGVYITGNIQMRSNVILDIGGTSSIIGSANASHWTRNQSQLVLPPGLSPRARSAPARIEGASTMLAVQPLHT